MPAHKVRKGDCIVSIAAEHGFADWRAVWNHPGNAELRTKRLAPGVLLEGDNVVLPEPREAAVTVSTGKLHRFTFRVPSIRLRLVLKTRCGRALASRRFELDVGGKTLSGTTDDSGRLDAGIPATAKRAQLRLFLDGDEVLERLLEIGHLDPDDSTSGLRQRLRNLGYLCEREPGEELVDSALRAFQRDNDLETADGADVATRERLRQNHKS